MRMENAHIPQRPALGIVQHQAFHGRDSCSNPRLSLLKIFEDYLASHSERKRFLIDIICVKAAQYQRVCAKPSAMRDR
jgi:hypothetical protein